MDTQEIVSIEWVLKELSLSDAPMPQAMSILLSYIEENYISIYFSASLQGTDASHGYEVIENGPDDVTFLIANAESVETDGTMRLLEGNYFNSGDGDFIDVIKYQFNGEDFFPTEVSGMFLEPVKLPFMSFHSPRTEVLDCKTKLDVKQSTGSKLKSKPLKGDVGAIKALALLAREKAEASRKFRTDQKVNASAFKKHILELANKIIDSETHDPEGYLKSLDDTVNKALKQYEIKEIPPDRIKNPS